MEWRKSSYSSETADCVEVTNRATRPTVGIRDSKRPEGGHLVVPRAAFQGLCDGFGRSK
ncbi:DUF397 domain-containing protein [Actinophytocola gossypii]|uniref:DUF397 domain-containing protein n=1 Tax=Actinophytocola gossypii TaxID=2812003 RepID=A0ABT2JEX6_9PSEU|nr:DUF397 domain-containing protein [Actinophytocola gossypii]MCT2586432.1 DUF397 domain-containing protein [Actinophytocola gossypii]